MKQVVGTTTALFSQNSHGLNWTLSEPRESRTCRSKDACEEYNGREKCRRGESHTLLSVVRLKWTTPYWNIFKTDILTWYTILERKGTMAHNTEIVQNMKSTRTTALLSASHTGSGTWLTATRDERQRTFTKHGDAPSFWADTDVWIVHKYSQKWQKLQNVDYLTKQERSYKMKCYCLFSTDLNKINHIKEVYM